MDTVVQSLIIVVPSLIILGIVYVMMNGFLDSMKKMFMEEYRRRKDEAKSLNQVTVAPLRVQAYERMILFLERISPSNLVMRTHHSGITAHELHAELIKSIRSEYDHNLSQQVYLSIGAWEMIKTAKEETAKIINISAEKTAASASGLDFAQNVISIASQIKKLPTDVAIEYLKKEFAEQF
ncbi:MAG TPA: hypothetical protein VII99_06110 [Bacteroidia bacterium]